MKILAIYRHYWPDTTPYARLLRLILERRNAAGDAVTVVTGQPGYNDTDLPKQPWLEALGGVEVRRVALPPERKSWRLLRAVAFAWFLLRAVIHATIFRRYDVVLANSHPPVAMGVTLRVIAWLTGAKYVLHVQDVHPESACVLRGTAEPSGLAATARRLDAWACAGAAECVTLSDDMRRSLERRATAPSRVRVINNCRLPQFNEPDVPAEATPDLGDRAKTRVLFAGNVGRFQALDAVIDAAAVASDRESLALTVLGDGAMRAELERRADQRRVRFYGHRPLAVAESAMRVADYGLVSLAPEIIRYAYPSKTMAYLAAGLPLLLVVEPDSELAVMTRKERLGIVARDASVEGVAAAFDEAVARREEWTPRERQRLAGFVESRFGADAMLNAWVEVFQDLRGGEAIQATDLSQRAAA